MRETRRQEGRTAAALIIKGQSPPRGVKERERGHAWCDGEGREKDSEEMAARNKNVVQILHPKERKRESNVAHPQKGRAPFSPGRLFVTWHDSQRSGVGNKSEQGWAS